MNLIRPNGTAELGTAELFVDPANANSPIGVRNVRAGDGTPLLMQGEIASISNSPALASKPAAVESNLSARLEELARDPDHGGSTTGLRLFPRTSTRSSDGDGPQRVCGARQRRSRCTRSGALTRGHLTFAISAGRRRYRARFDLGLLQSWERVPD